MKFFFLYFLIAFNFVFYPSYCDKFIIEKQKSNISFGKVFNYNTTLSNLKVEDKFKNSSIVVHVLVNKSASCLNQFVIENKLELSTKCETI